MSRLVLSHLGRAASFAGSTALAMGLGTSTLQAAVTPPDMFGIVPNYANSPTPVLARVTITGDGSGAAALAQVDLATGAITGFTLVSGGAGYTSATVSITGGNNDAAATATVDTATGQVTGITLVGAGSGYNQPLAGTYMRKFVDSLPGLNAANNLGQSLPVAVPDTVTYPGADYYVIEFGQYAKQLHSDLPATRLRGYRQVNNGTDTNGQNTLVPPAGFQYLGPVIVAHKDRPVRVKYINHLPTGAGGQLFIPTDTTYMGVGAGPNGGDYTQNRATVHLHGGTTPWISDGTPYQYITPAGESTSYPTGVSKTDVPDMWYDKLATGPDGGYVPILSCTGQPTCTVAGKSPTNEPGPGMNTMYYSNQQSARLMFYHDHALGITRLNVYAGMAAGYLNTDPTEQTLISGGTLQYVQPDGTPKAVPVAAGTLPGLGIPLVIQEKSFVPPTSGAYTNLMGRFDSQLAAQDPTWDQVAWGGYGALWYPHVYMPNQNPYDTAGANPMGRWDYGPWFWPPFTGIQNGVIANPLCPTPGTCPPGEPPMVPGTPDERGIAPSGTPESFMDTPVVNGTAYPYIEVPAAPVRLRILSVANDRFMNLSLFVAADKTSATTAGTTGAVLCDGTTAVNPANCTEVKMVPFNSTQDQAQPFPSWWYTPIPNGFTFDDRAGGVPDPSTRGPAMIQIGTEGGFLPGPVVIKNQPVNYVYNRRDIVVGNVNEKALFLGPAERADVIVDFSQFAGKTLILYNDSPAPVPAADPRLDYYTGNPDQTDTGGAPSTLPGYGPNTRTIMQIRVAATGAAPGSCVDPVTLQPQQGTQDCVNKDVLDKLTTALPAAFAASQEPIIVPQAAYNPVYGTTVADVAGANLATIQATEMTFAPIGQPSLTLPLEPKSIIEDFTVDYGRMNALLGLEIPHTNNTNQTSIIQAYIDPPTELVQLTAANNPPPVGTAADGTQVWKITHNGVDTHAIHFHMFHVQIVNRVGWDGAIRKPDPNELGWKDTVRMNPLEDIVVAMRPRTLDLPFKVKNSERLLDPTRPAGVTTGFTGVDPNGNPVTVTNELVNFGWEHVWHCHILGHEENDMMRALAVVAPPEDPTGLAATRSGNDVVLTWADNSANETSFTLQRSTSSTFPAPPTVIALAPNLTSYTDKRAAFGGYFYRVVASNTVGAPTPGYPQLTASSGMSNTAQIPQIPVGSVAPAALSFGAVTIGSSSSAQTVTLSNTGVVPLTFTASVPAGFTQTNSCGGAVAPSAGCAISVAFVPTTAGTVTGNLALATNDPAHATLTVSLGGTGVQGPAAPTGVSIERTGATAATVTWTDNSNNEASFQVQSSTNGGLTWATPATRTSTTAERTGTGVRSLSVTVSNTTNARYRVVAVQTTPPTPALMTPSAAPYAALNDTVAPTAPALAGNPVMTGNGNGNNRTVALTWTDLANNNASYTVQRCNGTCTAAGAWTNVTTTLAGNATSYTNTGLNRRTIYSFRIQAVNSVGTIAGNIVTVTTP